MNANYINSEARSEPNSSLRPAPTTADGDSRPEHPIGTFSSSSPNPRKTSSKNIAPGKTRACPSTVFRADYRRHGRISYLEAADYAGVSVATIQNWICRGKARLPVCARVGTYRIDLAELDKYLRRGARK